MWKKRLVAATFLPVLDRRDLLYKNTSAKYLQMIDTVDHTSLRFITNCRQWHVTVSCSQEYGLLWSPEGSAIGICPYTRQHVDFFPHIFVLWNKKYWVLFHPLTRLLDWFLFHWLGLKRDVGFCPFGTSYMEYTAERLKTELIALSAFKSKLKVLRLTS